jgi:aldehyde:ferredoxin oxidoreductase
MFRDAVEQTLSVKAESCFKCAIACHKNIYEKNADASRGEFLAKFDYEPLNLLSTNLGIHDPAQAATLVGLGDQLGMDSISLGATVAYVLDYNQRHPETPLCNAAVFGDFEKIRELILATGRGELPQVGHGVMRLAAQTGDTAYAMHVKGLELPAYLPETNPGYAWAVAGGHMSMMTYMLYALEGNASVEYWRKAITERGLFFVRDDLLGVCKFAMLDVEGAVQALELGAGLTIAPDELLAAVRRSFIRALWLERKQGYQKNEYTLPAQVSDDPNPALKAEHFVSREFLDQLSSEVWAVFDKEIDALCA